MRLLPLVVAALVVAGCEPEPGPTGGGALIVTHGASVQQHVNELSGGTLAIAGGGRWAAATDADHDLVWIADLSSGGFHARVRLPAGSQPQRIIEDGDGRLRVALRGTGQVATISPSSGNILATVDVCPEVRGLSWSKASSSLLVACAGGELVTISDSAVTTAVPAPDLRDVVQVGGETWVSTFRSSKLLKLDAGGAVAAEVTFPSIPLPPVAGKPTNFVPAVAWRTIATPDGRIVTLHHNVVDGDISAIQVPTAPPAPAYYQNVCQSSIVRSVVTVVSGGQVIGSADLAGVLPIDVAVSPDNAELAVAQPGSRWVQRVPLAGVSEGVRGGICAPSYPDTAPVGQVTGVAYTPQNTLVVHTREPMAVWVLGVANGARTQKEILFTDALVKAPGHQLFHDATGAIACASCHPEGGEDGHTWTLFKQTVRTQPLGGGLLETAPFHWSGAIPNLKALLNDTFVSRMGGTAPTPEVVTALSDWMETIPRGRASTQASPDVVAHGDALFHDSAVGCSSCHVGKELTNNATMDVGTGGSFQVPSLRGVSLHGPWMHDGCAQALKDRFGSCGGTHHGNTGALSEKDVDSLVAYLGTL